EGVAPTPEPEKQEPPQGIDLVPPAFPTQTPSPEKEEEPQEDEEPPNAAALAPSSGETVAATAGTATVADRVAAADLAADEVVTAAAIDTTSAATGVTLAAQRTPAKVRLRLVPGALGVATGDTFELRIDADAKVPLSHLPLVVAYNAQVVEPTSWV